MSQLELREFRPADIEPARPTAADVEATTIARAAAVIAAILVATAGVFAFFGLLQPGGLALLAALAASIASVAGRPSRGHRWVAPAAIGAMLITLAIESLLR
jgi:hypothetical protein